MAVDFEARGLTRRLARNPVGVDSPRLLIRAVGVGSTLLDRLGPTLEALHPAAVVVTGLAGGCAPDIRPGQIVLGNPVGPTATGAWITPEASLMHRAIQALDASSVPYRVGRLVSVRGVAATPQAKTELWRTEGGIAVDMESADVLDWARRAGLPALAIRGVADGPAESLPPPLARGVSHDGRVQLATVASWIARPALLGAAWRLWRRSDLAFGHLARFLSAFEALRP
ncbi:MAG: hypothetical protein ACRELA_15505 [Candidatus Rokuibacteriota bacterium]